MDLHNIDVVVDDEDLAIFLLRSLPSPYKSFREIFLYSRENLSSDNVKNELIQRDLIKKQLTQKQNVSNEGLFVKGRANHSSSSGKNKNRSKSRVFNKAKTCHYWRLKWS